MIVKCCVCHKVRENEAWRSAEPAELTDQSVSHGYCPDCAEAAFREIRAMRYQRPEGTPLAANQ